MALAALLGTHRTLIATALHAENPATNSGEEIEALLLPQCDDLVEEVAGESSQWHGGNEDAAARVSQHGAVPRPVWCARNNAVRRIDGSRR